MKYERLKKKKGGYDMILSKGHSGPLTSEILADEFKVSEKTIKRDSQFSKGIDMIGEKYPTLKLQILSKEVKVKKADIQFLGTVKAKNIRRLKNEADLHNELQIMKRNYAATEGNEKQKLKDEKRLAAEKHMQEIDAFLRRKRNKSKEQRHVSFHKSINASNNGMKVHLIH